MDNHTTTTMKVIGLDVSDEECTYVVLDERGEVAQRGKVPTSAMAIRRRFARLGPCLVALEVGTHSRWLNQVLKEAGHIVHVANARKLELITRSQKKTDRADAELLAKLARVDPSLLSPIEHRGERAQAHLELVKAREHVVEGRAKFINHLRGVVKSYGGRLPRCSAAAFAEKVTDFIPRQVLPQVLPLIEHIKQLSETIRWYDRQVERLCRTEYPQTEALRQVTGVGALTALTYVLVIEQPARFRRSREVGAYLGLVPRQQQSGERRPELHITRAGDICLRKLLVQCAHYVMGPFGPDCELRRWGQKLAGEGSSARKKRAIIAVARKLAVLLHRLWSGGEVYDPFYRSKETPIAA